MSNKSYFGVKQMPKEIFVIIIFNQFYFAKFVN